MARASIVIPAHNEEVVITRLLHQLLEHADDDELQIIVVCNGCTDRTAEVARAFEPRLVVDESPVPSKYAALQLGNSVATSFPRLYIDADVDITIESVRALIRALDGDITLAAGPDRIIDYSNSSRLVRSYYRLWLQLPAVQAGLFGRGVIALSRQGYERVALLPHVMSDDLAVSEAFSDSERRIVDTARVTIRAPRTVRALVDRRVRVHTGNAQLDRVSGRSTQAMTSTRDLLGIIRHRPLYAPDLAIFLAVAVIARFRARKHIASNDFDTWLRDDSRVQDEP